MYVKLFTTVTSASCVFTYCPVSFTPDAPMSSPALEARRIAREYFEDSTLRCGDSRVLHSEGAVGVGDGYFEVRWSKVVVEPAEITEADKVNSTIWKGDVRTGCAMFRKCGTSEWKECSTEAASTFFWAVVASGTPVHHQLRIVKRNGDWESYEGGVALEEPDIVSLEPESVDFSCQIGQ